MALIKCENVSIGYEGQMVVHDLNFEINQGDYLCIVGENGSGKSTLVKSLLGLKNVDKGKIVFDDGLKQTEIGYLPQQTDVKKDFPASVYEVVLSGRLNSRGMKPFYSAEDKKQAWEKLLLLDEPVTGLDPIVTAEFYQLISRINKESGIAVVMVSHDIESAVEYASHILHLQETVLYFGKADGYEKSRAGKTFLGGETHV